MKYLAALCTFLVITCIVAWFFWAAGYNFDKRGGSLFLFSLISVYLGSTAAWLTYSLWKD